MRHYPGEVFGSQNGQYGMRIDEKNNDGGPGSGNWGHGGRPGKIGGSSGGGGVANRKGSKEKGFSSEAKERAAEKKAEKSGGAGNGGTHRSMTFSKKGAPTAKELGFNEEEYKKYQAQYMKKNGIKHSWNLYESDKKKIMAEYSESQNLPKRIKTKDCDYEIDHYDYVGGHFSYNGTYKGYTVGQEYNVPGKSGVKAKIASIHVYPNGKGEATGSYRDEHGISGNYKFTGDKE